MIIVIGGGIVFGSKPLLTKVQEKLQQIIVNKRVQQGGSFVFEEKIVI